MVRKKLDLSESSSDEDEQASPLAAAVPVPTATNETNDSTDEEEENSEEDGSSSDEDEQSSPRAASGVVKTTTKNTKVSSDEEGSEEDDSSSDEDEQSSPPAASAVVPATEETKISTNEEEEEEDDSSSDEDETMIQKKQTTSETEKKISVSRKAQKRKSEETPSGVMKDGKKAKTKEKKISVSSEVTPSGEMKDAKKEETNEKNMLFQRIWSTEDEMIMLQGIVDFKTRTGKSPNEDKNGFYEFIKESIIYKASFSQCFAKIGSLRRKFLNKAVKGKKPSWNYHELKCFELSEQIWGSVVSGKNGAEESKVVIDLEKEDKDVVVLEKEEEWFSNTLVLGLVAKHGLNEVSVKRLWGQVSKEKKKEMQERWSILQIKDADIVIQKSEYVKDLFSLISDGPSSSH